MLQYWPKLLWQQFKTIVNVRTLICVGLLFFAAGLMMSGSFQPPLQLHDFPLCEQEFTWLASISLRGKPSLIFNHSISTFAKTYLFECIFCMTFAIGMDNVLFLQCPLSIWLHTMRIRGSSVNRSQSTKHLSSRGTGRLSSATAPSQCNVL